MNDDKPLDPEHPVERFKNMSPEQQEREFSRLCDEVIMPVAKWLSNLGPALRGRFRLMQLDRLFTIVDQTRRFHDIVASMASAATALVRDRMVSQLSARR